ncbi:MAG: gas vesicle protein [Candidatus Omnitrophica bacterium]|nr:gas vesicle protein [Candidatus Omnitrophota bacterium]
MAVNTEEAKAGKSGSVSFIVNQAKKELAALTKLELSTVMGVTKEGAEWLVTMEMVEKKSIPDGMDLLGAYEVHMDNSGQVLNFNRISIRKRGDTG